MNIVLQVLHAKCPSVKTLSRLAKEHNRIRGQRGGRPPATRKSTYTRTEIREQPPSSHPYLLLVDPTSARATFKLSNNTVLQSQLDQQNRFAGPPSTAEQRRWIQQKRMVYVICCVLVCCVDLPLAPFGPLIHHI